MTLKIPKIDSSKPSVFILDPHAESSTFNPMDSGDANTITSMLSQCAQVELSESQHRLAIDIISNLPKGSTVSSFVESAKERPELHKFALAVGMAMLDTRKYAHIYENDYGKREPQ